MLCPKCQTEVSSWQFYCPQCRTALQDYNEYGRDSRRQSFDRVGAKLINLIIVLALIGGSVLVARQIDWKELVALFRDPGAGVRSQEPVRRQNKAGSAGRRAKEEPESAGAASFESVRQLPQKIEELPSPDEVPGPAQPPPPKKQDDAEPENREPREAALSLDPTEIQPHEGRQGFITIRSYTSARIYVNGQYSGTTPKTVKLSSGDHQIRLIADGYEDWTRNVRLKNRQQIGIIASMKKLR